MRDESSASNAAVPVIPSQHRITRQILIHWQPFRDLKLKFEDSCLTEHLRLRSQQRIVSVFTPISWLGQTVAVCGCRKFQLDALGDHLCICTVHSGVKKVHDWVVDQLTDLFCTTHKVKTQHVSKIHLRGRKLNVSIPFTHSTQCVRETFIFKYFPLPLVLSTIINNNNMS